jgi:hypothetical protein
VLERAVCLWKQLSALSSAVLRVDWYFSNKMRN